MKVLVGLGNPGLEYAETRHNAGFMFVDALQQQRALPQFNRHAKSNAYVSKSSNYVLVKPQTYMNESGRAVVAVLKYFNLALNDVYLVHDDLDLELGSYQIVHGKGPKVHNGVNSVIQQLGTPEFQRIRIGVDGRNLHPELSQLPGRDYVLQRFLRDEQELFTQVCKKIVLQLHT